MGRTGGSRSPGELGTPSVDSPSQTKPLSPSSLAGLSGRQWHMDSINRLEASLPVDVSRCRFEAREPMDHCRRGHMSVTLNVSNHSIHTARLYPYY